MAGGVTRSFAILYGERVVPNASNVAESAGGATMDGN
jgi:hypothetical protein